MTGRKGKAKAISGHSFGEASSQQADQSEETITCVKICCDGEMDEGANRFEPCEITRSEYNQKIRDSVSTTECEITQWLGTKMVVWGTSRRWKNRSDRYNKDAMLLMINIDETIFSDHQMPDKYIGSVIVAQGVFEDLDVMTVQRVCHFLNHNVDWRVRNLLHRHRPVIEQCHEIKDMVTWDDIEEHEDMMNAVHDLDMGE